MTNTTLITLERNDRLVQLWQCLLADPVAPDPAARHGRAGGFDYGMNEEAEWTEPAPFTGTVELGLASHRWRVDLAAWFHSLAEPEGAGSAGPSAGEAISEDEALSGLFQKAVDEETLALSSPFRWEPKPVWINAPVRSDPPFMNKADPVQFAARPKIPIRPLHKQPFFLRIFFYLRRWLSKSR